MYNLSDEFQIWTAGGEFSAKHWAISTHSTSNTIDPAQFSILGYKKRSYNCQIHVQQLVAFSGRLFVSKIILI